MSAAPSLHLYHYWRSTSSWRVRWALALKGVIGVKLTPIDLVSGQSESPEHVARHPLGYVPLLEITSGAKSTLLTQSMAMVEWIDQTWPTPPLFEISQASSVEEARLARAHIQELVWTIAADTHPVQNLSVQLKHAPENADERTRWAAYWIELGLGAYQTLLMRGPFARRGRYSVGDSITAADLCLIPQLYNARRFGVELGKFAVLIEIEAACKEHSTFAGAAPEAHQPG